MLTATTATEFPPGDTKWVGFDARFDTRVEPMWKPDGFEYVDCYRCGITMRVPTSVIYSSGERLFCKDCNHPDFLAPFRPGWTW